MPNLWHHPNYNNHLCQVEVAMYILPSVIQFTLIQVYVWLFSLTDIPGSVESISSLDEGKGQVKVVVTANATGKQGLGATKIVHFTLPDTTPDSKLN